MDSISGRRIGRVNRFEKYLRNFFPIAIHSFDYSARAACHASIFTISLEEQLVVGVHARGNRALLHLASRFLASDKEKSAS